MKALGLIAKLKIARRFRGLASLSFTVALILIFQEFSVRLALPAYDPSTQLQFLAGDDRLPPLGAPNSVKRHIKNTGDFDVSVNFNQYGLRDSKDVKNARETDLFVVGDSFVFGWGVTEQQRVSDQIQELFPTTAYNLASGRGNIDDYEKLLNFAAAAGAKVGRTLIFVNMENDLISYRPTKRTEITPKSPKQSKPSGVSLKSVKKFLLSNSALYFLATSLVHRTEWLRNAAIDFGLITPANTHVGTRNPGPAAIQSSANRLASLIERYDGTVVLIPSRGIWIQKSRDDTLNTHTRFRMALSKKGLNFIDLCPAFTGTGDPLSLHFRNDGHWNKMGHYLAARTIVNYLKQSTRTLKNQNCT